MTATATRNKGAKSADVRSEANGFDFLEGHRQAIVTGNARVHPGQPFRLNEAASVNDGCWQGDLGFKIVAKVPAGWKEVKNPTAKDLQLVPGNTEGSRHCLASFENVRLFRRDEWEAKAEEDFLGPVLVVGEAGPDAESLHPTHGPIAIAPGHTVALQYQKVWDQIEKRERRQRD